jgi:1,2-phenylacetyl-CoA epoxidase catalytic subunit
MSDALDVHSLDDAGRAALARLIITLADSKRLMGIRYSDWLLGAPSIETGISTSSMTQDEWGHARLLYAMLKHLDVDPKPVEYDRSGDEFASVAPLDEEFPDWAAVVAAMVLVDGGISSLLRSFAEGNFEPAQSRVPKMLAEEEFHGSLGRAWYRRLAASGGEALECLTAATEAMVPPMLAWVGADDAASKALAEAGVIQEKADRLEAYKDEIRELVALVGMNVDSVSPSAEWDEARGRTSGRPNEDSVGRARGDLNRALLVE